MHDRGVPFATHGRTDMGVEHPYFDFDNEAFARLMVREMAVRGRRRLLLVAPPKGQSYARHMMQGFREEAAARGLTAEIADEVTSDSPPALVQAFAAEVFGAQHRPDGVVLGSATSSMAMVTGGEGRGLVLGRDFDVATKDSVHFLHRFRSEMMVVHEDVTHAGDFLARAVMAAIEHSGAQPIAQHLAVPRHLE